MSSINLFNANNKFEIPIYFCCGDNDYHTPSKIVEDCNLFELHQL